MKKNATPHKMLNLRLIKKWRKKSLMRVFFGRFSTTTSYWAVLKNERESSENRNEEEKLINGINEKEDKYTDTRR